VRPIVCIAALVLAGCSMLPPQPHEAYIPTDGSGGVAGFVRAPDGSAVRAVVTADCQTMERSYRSEDDGWYDLGPARLTPGSCTIHARVGEDVSSAVVVVVAAHTQRLDFVVPAA